MTADAWSFGSPWSRAFAVVGAALVLSFVGAALFGADGVHRHEKLREDLRQVEALNADLRVENQRLQREAAALKHDPGYLEAVIRDELGWVQSDEIVFMFAPALEERSP